MTDTRKVHSIRYGKKSGVLTAYIHPKDHEQLNPFVLWDHFSAKAVMHSAGLDYHGHSGIDAISYPVIGKLNHRDSAGSHVTLASGDVHIMTSGKGIIHKDTLTPKNGQIEAFSLWTVLPAGSKEMAPACSTNIDAHHLPLVEEKCTITKVIIGHYKGANSPVQYSIPITYLDVMIAPYSCWSFQPMRHKAVGLSIYNRVPVTSVAIKYKRNKWPHCNPHICRLKFARAKLRPVYLLSWDNPCNSPFILLSALSTPQS
ncbi:pirin-like protein YhhW [Photobacterium aphoticum]|uniref:Pirin-like protein YhhW n=1 Tax=Photobacterium aphoticum TaxID=754436 RepID=A0A090QWE6_9GAMM|nr:pirin-like protein YhhW [Photobacterium aphoticum]